MTTTYGPTTSLDCGPPDPTGSGGLDSIASSLRLARSWACNPSYRDIARDIGRVRHRQGCGRRPGHVTVYEHFRDGRRRMDPALVVDIARVLGVPDTELWRWRHAMRTALAAGESSGDADPAHRTVPPLNG